MAFLPISLGVRHSSDAEKGAARDPASLKNQTEKVLKRDDYACRFCGFHSLRFQRVVPSNEAGDIPYATACIFCEQCLNLERGGITGAGILVWLPEIEQAELNHIVRAIYVALASGTDMADSAKHALDGLMARRADAKKRLGSDDPLLLATVIQELLTQKEGVKAGGKLDGIRLLPPDKYMARGKTGDTNQFPQLVKYWCSSEGPYAKLPVERWREMFKSATAKTGNA